MQVRRALGAPRITGAWGVESKAAPGGQDGRICGMSEGGIAAGEPGGREPPRRLSGGRCGGSRRQSCAARWRRRRRQRRHECPHLCGHQCRARCAARCAAKPAPARHGVHRLPKPRRRPQPAQPARASEARSATSAARSAGARRAKRMSGAVSGRSALRVGCSASGARSDRRERRRQGLQRKSERSGDCSGKPGREAGRADSSYGYPHPNSSSAPSTPSPSAPWASASGTWSPSALTASAAASRHQLRPHRRHRHGHQHAARIVVEHDDTLKANAIDDDGGVNTEVVTMMHEVATGVLPKVTRRVRESVGDESGGAAAERGAAGDARSEGGSCGGVGVRVRPKKKGHAAEETVKVFPASDPGSCIARTCYLYRQSKRPHRGSPPWPRDATRRCSPEAR